MSYKLKWLELIRFFSCYRPCALSEETSSPCSYLMKLEDDINCYYISSNCRDRVSHMTISHACHYSYNKFWCDAFNFCRLLVYVTFIHLSVTFKRELLRRKVRLYIQWTLVFSHLCLSLLATEVYWQVARCRASMNLACLCLSLPDS